MTTDITPAQLKRLAERRYPSNKIYIEDGYVWVRVFHGGTQASTYRSSPTAPIDHSVTAFTYNPLEDMYQLVELLQKLIDEGWNVEKSLDDKQYTLWRYRGPFISDSYFNIAIVKAALRAVEEIEE